MQKNVLSLRVNSFLKSSSCMHKDVLFLRMNRILKANDITDLKPSKNMRFLEVQVEGLKKLSYLPRIIAIMLTKEKG